MSEWISVEDRLPDENNDEFICYVSNKNDKSVDFVSAFVYENGEFGDTKYGNNFNKWLTHWMPLPEPPK